MAMEIDENMGREGFADAGIEAADAGDAADGVLGVGELVFEHGEILLFIDVIIDMQ